MMIPISLRLLCPRKKNLRQKKPSSLTITRPLRHPPSISHRSSQMQAQSLCFILCLRKHPAHNTLPSALKGLHGIEPVDILNLFLTQSLLETMRANTNAYSAENIAGKTKDGGRTWTEVTAEELGGWIGIVIYMGVHCSPAIYDYWVHRNGLNPKHPTSDYMSQTR
jgi:hypothetical protein